MKKVPSTFHAPRHIIDSYENLQYNICVPEIIQKYIIKDVAYENLYADCLTVLRGLKAEDIKEAVLDDTSKEISGTLPSIWGWGGMKLSTKLVSEGDTVVVQLVGYIAQLSTSPLTKNMDGFLSSLQSLLKQKYNYDFEYEKLTKFLPSYKLSINAKDKKAFVVILLVTLCTTLAGALFGHASESFLGIVAVVLGYKFGKKYFYKN